jgi:cell division protein FtsL
MDEANLDELEEDWMNMVLDENDQASSLTVDQRHEEQHMNLFYNEMPTITDSIPN